MTTLTQLCPAQPNMCSTVANSSINLIEALVLLVNYIKKQFKPLIKGETVNEDDSEDEVQEDDLKTINFIDNIITTYRRVCWLVGSISFNFVRIKSQELTKEEL